ncbi:MAG: hypothetical protein JWP63_3946 [Candidatus Solibacter sp.]|nr:hypothetical protein [Candidatus Solibacter sp.]
MAAWEVGGFALANLDPNKPYIGPQTCTARGERRDFRLAKRTKLGEKRGLEIRAQFLNAFNMANFLLGSAGRRRDVLVRADHECVSRFHGVGDE